MYRGICIDGGTIQTLKLGFDKISVGSELGAQLGQLGLQLLVIGAAGRQTTADGCLQLQKKPVLQPLSEGGGGGHTQT